MDIDMGEGFNGSKRRNERILPICDGTVMQNLEKNGVELGGELGKLLIEALMKLGRSRRKVRKKG